MTESTLVVSRHPTRELAIMITTTSRRNFLRSSTLAVTASVIGSTLESMLTTQAETRPSFSPSVVKALFFDVFGTLVDWRAGVSRDAESILKPLGYSIDWKAFADTWRDEYQPGMEEVRSGRIPYTKLDVLHRRMLQKILPRFGLEKLDASALDQLTLAWHRLDAWKDVPAGLAKLRQGYLIAPVSNGNVALMSDLARRNDFHWDAILGADWARDYKPKAAVYLAAVDAFNLQPSQCIMCAAHSGDLKAAADNGLKTAFIARPQERPGVSETAPNVAVDIVARSIEELAAKLSKG
jgi:2-haloacid dehalogenase